MFFIDVKIVVPFMGVLLSVLAALFLWAPIVRDTHCQRKYGQGAPIPFRRRQRCQLFPVGKVVRQESQIRRSQCPGPIRGEPIDGHFDQALVSRCVDRRFL